MRGSKFPPPLQEALLTEGEGLRCGLVTITVATCFLYRATSYAVQMHNVLPGYRPVSAVHQNMVLYQNGWKIEVVFDTGCLWHILLRWNGREFGYQQTKGCFSTDTLHKSQNLAEADFSVSSTVAGDRFITLSAGLCLYSTLWLDDPSVRLL